MDKNLPITDIFAREILDSRGNPTIEVEILADHKYIGRSSVPSGASTGSKEAKELRDHEERYHGMGVRQAVENVNNEMAGHLIGMNVLDQVKIDNMLIKMDGTKDKSNLGANAILGVSLAAAKTAASALEIPLYRYIGGINTKRMPVPMMNILNGGKHADNTLDFQEFMILPVGAQSFEKGLQMCTEIYHELKKYLKDHGMGTAVGDEGGFAPDLKNSEEALKLMVKAVENAGYCMEDEIVFAIDAAASEIYDQEQSGYIFKGEEGKKIRSSKEMVEYYEQLVSKFPIVSLEDPLDEEDFEGWKMITKKLGDKVQIVGDDLFVTNTERLRKGIREHMANAILIKVNQIGTLTETADAIKMAETAGYNVIISHRSGETEDTVTADLAVGFHAGQIKCGAPCRTERTAKYNQLLRIGEKLEETALYSNPF